jgi:hypothetical protein
MPACAPNRDRFAAAGAVFQLNLADGFRQYLQLLAAIAPVLGQRDGLLNLHQLSAARFGHRLRHTVRQFGRPGALLDRVGEDADVVELHLAHEVEQRPELRVGLARIAHDEGRAHGQIGQLLSRVGHQPARHLDIAGAAHGAQHVVVGVLDRHVEVRQQLLVLGNHVDHAQRQRAGIDVKQA